MLARRCSGCSGAWECLAHRDFTGLWGSNSFARFTRFDHFVAGPKVGVTVLNREAGAGWLLSAGPVGVVMF